MLRLELGRLKHDVGNCLSFDMTADVDSADYGYGDMPLFAPLVLQGKAENMDGEILLTGQLKATLAIACSRCGLVFPLPFSLPFSEIYTAQDAALDEEGLQDKHAFSGTSIDLAPEALRALYGQLPMKPLCREDCQGLCPHCGTDLNRASCSCAVKETDPRWEKLRELNF